MSEPTQSQQIQKHLERHGSITALEALDLYGCFRLAARIKDLKDDGMDIKSNKVRASGGAVISRYYIDHITEGQQEFSL